MRVPLVLAARVRRRRADARAARRAADAARHGGQGRSRRWGADWRNVVVGELLTVERHPRADRLSLTTRRRRRPASRSRSSAARPTSPPASACRSPCPGAVLPGNRRIERTEKMGVVSNGMLCSGDELRLTGDADGILILPADTPLGAPLTELYGDVVLDVDVKPNRGDALSIVGLAREVAAVTGGPVRLPGHRSAEEPGRPIDRAPPGRGRSSTDLCPRFVGRWVSGVRVGPSPDWVQMRLMAAGQRPVSNVVDAQQLRHARARQADPHVRRGRRPRRPDRRPPGRRRASGSRRSTTSTATLDAETLLIADPRGPHRDRRGHGRRRRRRSATARPRSIVESAIFDPVSIRRTAFRYALRSEASLRFEKGQELRLARLGADRTARLIAEWAGGAVAPGAVDTEPGRAAAGPRRVPAGPGQPAARDVRLPTARAARAAGAGRRSRRSRPPPGRRSRSRPEPKPLEVDPGARRDPRRDRPELAPRPARRGRRDRGGRPGPRLRDRARRSCRTRRCPHYRHSPLERPRHGPRDARRRRPDARS